MNPCPAVVLTLGLAALVAVAPNAAAQAAPPTDNPVAGLKLAWTDTLKWGQVVSITDFAGDTADARLAAAQKAVAEKGGGVNVAIEFGHIEFGTGCTAIRSSGDGAYSGHSVVRPQNNGKNMDTFTNNNRAIEVRGWRWTIERNDYEVYSNFNLAGHAYGDGEGIMHEAFNNVDLRDSRLIGNRGNRCLCVWRIPVDGLLIQDNDIGIHNAGNATPKDNAGFEEPK